MCGSAPAAPPPPDYAAAATAQGAANVDAAKQQGIMNNPNINGPLGNQSVTFDPNTGQPTVDQTLTPTAQQTLDAQQNVQLGLANLGQQGLGTAQNALANPFTPNLPNIQTGLSTSGVPAMPGQVPNSPNLQTSMNTNGIPMMPNAPGSTALQTQLSMNLPSTLPTPGTTNLQNGVNTSGIAQMPVNAGTTGQDAIMERLAPQLQRMQNANAQQLANQGITQGSEAYRNAMTDQGNQQNDLLTQAALQGINLDMSANNQGYNQALQSGQFANTAANDAFTQAMNQFNAAQTGNQNSFNQQLTGAQFGNTAQTQQQANNLNSYNAGLAGNQQGYNQALSNAQFGNTAATNQFSNQLSGYQAGLSGNQQGYNQALQNAQFGNTAIAQSLQQQLALRNQPLNEITGLMSGSQIQMPQFQGYQGSTVAPAPIFGATQAQGQNDMSQYGIASSNANAQNAGTTSLIGTGLMSGAVLL